jgi:hypothetical protein
MEGDIERVVLKTNLEKFQPLLLFYKILLWVIIGAVVFELPLIFMKDYFMSMASGKLPDITWLIVANVTGFASQSCSMVFTVFYFLWIYRAAKNLSTFNVGKPKYSPGWSVGWFFIPFANIVMPLLIMLEILKKSAARNLADLTGREQKQPSPLWIMLWWVLSLAPFVFAIGFFIYMVNIMIASRGDTAAFIDFIYYFVVGMVIAAALQSAATILMLLQITNLQESRFGEMKKNPLLAAGSK